MRHYYILTQNPNFVHVINYIKSHSIASEMHLNRTRFWIPEGPLLTEFIIRFGSSVEHVDPALDLATGLPL